MSSENQSCAFWQTALDRLMGKLRVRPVAYSPSFDYETAVSETISKVWSQDTQLTRTMTSPARLNSLILAVEHVIKVGLPGDFVECGVWRGGSMMAVALTLLRLGVTDRHIHMFDTFEGMTNPTDHDRDAKGNFASRLLDEDRDKSGIVWAVAGLATVMENLQSTNYPMENLHFVKGPVELTIPHSAPGQIAVLRLDTDWYASTRHELEHLFPRIVSGGFLIIDDYGHWNGARQAVDEYIASNKLDIFLHWIDYTGRIGVKTDSK